MSKIELPSEEIMRQMAKLAIEQVTTYFAQMAREFSEALPEDISGKDALDAFANAIDENNARHYHEMMRQQ